MSVLRALGLSSFTISLGACQVQNNTTMAPEAAYFGIAVVVSIALVTIAFVIADAVKNR